MNKTVLAVGLFLLSPLAWGQVETTTTIVVEEPTGVLVVEDSEIVDEDTEDMEDIDTPEYSEFVDDLENSDDVDNLED
jgi:hypothetical protein